MRSRRESEIGSQHSQTNSFRENASRRPRFSNQQDNGDPEFDVVREKRTNKYLAMMVTMYAILMCPLMVLRVVRLALLETYENARHFDITYTLFVWLAFLPTCTTPMLYTAWHMSRPTKERLKGYFRFSNRKIRRSCDAMETPYVSHAPAAASLGGTTSNRSVPRYHHCNQQPNTQQHVTHPHYAHQQSPPTTPPPPPPPQHHPLAYYEPQRQEEHHMMEILPDERDYAGYVYVPRSARHGNVLTDPD